LNGTWSIQFPDCWPRHRSMKAMCSSLIGTLPIKLWLSYETRKDGLQIQASSWLPGMRVKLRRKRWRERRSEK
jgi:hypothetical protein